MRYARASEVEPRADTRDGVIEKSPFAGPRSVDRILPFFQHTFLPKG